MQERFHKRASLVALPLRSKCENKKYETSPSPLQGVWAPINPLVHNSNYVISDLTVF